jgi:hypothetical protein
MILEQVGTGFYAVVLGWVLMYVLRRGVTKNKAIDWGGFTGFFLTIVGIGVVNAFWEKGVFGCYGIGLAVGFFANITVGSVLTWKEASQTALAKQAKNAGNKPLIIKYSNLSKAFRDIGGKSTISRI